MLNAVLFNSKGVTHTDPKVDDGFALWVVNLGDWYKISKIRVWNRVECANRINNAGVFAGKKLVGMIQYEEGKHCYEFDVGGYSANTASVALTTKLPLSLAQVEVYGTGEKGKIYTLNLLIIN